MSKKYDYIEPEAYLVEEARAEYKSEYYNGTVVAMSGASVPHNRVVGNLIGELHYRLKGKSCNVYPSDLKIVNNAKNSYLYPDLSIVCGKIETLPNNDTVVTNPTVIFEVLSETTERLDRGNKFHIYTGLPSVMEYVLVSSMECSIDLYRRIDGEWNVYMLNDPSATLTLESVGISIKLSDIYEGVSIEEI